MQKKPHEREPAILPAQPHGPAAAITRRAADRLRNGHLWVYRSDIDSLTPPIGADNIAPGVLITVTDSRGIPLGTGLYSSASQIAVRMVSATAALPRAEYLDQLRKRVQTALHLRDELAPSSAHNNACRLLFSEADALPGIIADRYHDLVILQLLTQSTAQEDVRTVLTETLSQHFAGNITLWERPDPRIRELEQLAAPSTEPLHQPANAAEPQLTTVFTINDLRFHFDAGSGQKTGAFLDQRLNYAAAARHARGIALDVCTYQGGFALHLAQHCQRVTGVDASRSALQVADRNLQLNPSLAAQVDWLEADAFELLREYESTGQRFDTIVLDPPAFAKSRRAAEGAMRGYKELNLRALKMLQPGGTLITCSCSHHVGLPEFTEVVASAAADASRTVQLLEVHGAAPDHPAILTLPETSYLKCLICRVA